MSVPVLETLPNGQVYFRSEANPKDWTMLELQGELQSTGTTAKLAGNLMQDGKSDHLIGLPLGALKLDHPSVSALNLPHITSWTLHIVTYTDLYLSSVGIRSPLPLP